MARLPATGMPEDHVCLFRPPSFILQKQHPTNNSIEGQSALPQLGPVLGRPEDIIPAALDRIDVLLLGVPELLPRLLLLPAGDVILRPSPLGRHSSSKSALRRRRKVGR